MLVHHGLESLAKCPTLGVATLMRVAGVEAKRHSDGQERLQSEDISFALAPRLNAAGRLGQPQLAVELLVTDRPERALELAQYIDQLNATRQTLERSIQLAAGKQINEQFDAAEDAAFVLAERGWHAGVIGIVAGRLAEKHHRPVVLIAQDQMGVKPGIGSGRSVPGFNLHAALAQCGELLVSYGGHWMAAGLKIEEDKVAAFRAAFCELAAAELSQPLRGGFANRRRGPLQRLHPPGRPPDRAPGPLRRAQRPAAALRQRRHAGRPAQAHRQRRTAPGDEAFPARRGPAGGGLWRRRMGRAAWPRWSIPSTWPSARSSIPIKAGTTWNCIWSIGG